MQLQSGWQQRQLALLIALALGCGKDSAPRSDDARPVDHSEQRGKQMVALAAACHEIDLAKEVAACRSACDLGHSNSCARVGEHHRLIGETDSARSLFEQACKGGSGLGCEGAANLAPEAEKPGWFQKARQYHRVHCEQDYVPSCVRLAGLHEAGLGGPSDRGVAAHYRQKACALGAKDACR